MTDYSDNQQYVSKFLSNGDAFLFCMNSCISANRKAIIKLKTSGKQSIELSYIIPAIANGAFACELYFKAIICMECGETTRGHELVKLHKKLSSKSKASLLKASGFNNTEMRTTLAQFDKAFEQARYFELKSAEPKKLQKLVLAAKSQTSVLLNEKLSSGAFSSK